MSALTYKMSNFRSKNATQENTSLQKSPLTGNIHVLESSYSMATMTMMLSLPAHPRVAHIQGLNLDLIGILRLGCLSLE
jgi:hypothetical protein